MEEKRYKRFRVRVYPNYNQKLQLEYNIKWYRILLNKLLEIDKYKYKEYLESNKSLGSPGIDEIVHDFYQWVDSDDCDYKYDSSHVWFSKKRRYTATKYPNSRLVRSVVNQYTMTYLSCVKTRTLRNRKYKTKSYTRYNPGERTRLTEQFDTHGLLIPKLGVLKMPRKFIFPDNYISCVMIQVNKKWYASLLVEESGSEKRSITDAVGIDLGVSYHSITSDGVKYPNFNREDQRITYWNDRMIYYDQKLASIRRNNSNWRHSHNYHKVRSKLDHCYEKMRNIRRNWIHEYVADISRNYKGNMIVLETIRIYGGLTKSGVVNNKSVFNMLWGYYVGCLCKKSSVTKEFSVMRVPSNYPSSKKCSRCGHTKDSLSLGDRIYRCDHCGLVEDRDINAAKNLRNYGLDQLEMIKS